MGRKPAMARKGIGALGEERTVRGRTPLQRFCAKVRLPETPDGCWEWVGRGRNGYGSLSVDGRGVPAHRYSYLKFIGPIPGSLVLDHFVCSNRGCVNPDHVRPVTDRENVLRSDTNIPAMNAAKETCRRGHPLVGDNLYVCPSGWRECRTCRSDAWAKYRRDRLGYQPRRKIEKTVE